MGDPRAPHPARIGGLRRTVTALGPEQADHQLAMPGGPPVQGGEAVVYGVACLQQAGGRDEDEKLRLAHQATEVGRAHSSPGEFSLRQEHARGAERHRQPQHRAGRRLDQGEGLVGWEHRDHGRRVERHRPRLPAYHTVC